MALAFNPRQAVRKLRDTGLDEPAAEAITEVVEDATGDLVTKEHLDSRNFATKTDLAELKANINQSLLILASFIVATAGVSLAIAAFFFN